MLIFFLFRNIKLELQDVDSQILLTQGQGSAGSNYSAMIMMNQQVSSPPNSGATFAAVPSSLSSATSSSLSSSSTTAVQPSPPSQQHHLLQSGDRSGGSVGLYHSALSSQPSSLGSSNGYGKLFFSVSIPTISFAHCLNSMWLCGERCASILRRCNSIRRTKTKGTLIKIYKKKKCDRWMR